MSGDRDQEYCGKCEKEIDEPRSLRWIVPLVKTPAAKKPDHCAGHQGESQMQEQVSLEFCAFQLPLPRRQSRGDSYGRTECRGDKVVVGRFRHHRIRSPDRQKIQRNADHE